MYRHLKNILEYRYDIFFIRLILFDEIMKKGQIQLLIDNWTRFDNMKIIKDVLKSALISIMMSMCIFVIVGLVFDQVGNGVFKMENYQFSKMVLACVITGLGFGVPTFLYSLEGIPMFLSSIIHLGVGFTIYFLVAAKVGWIPTSAGLTASLVTIVGVIVVGIVIWVCFMKYNKNLAERMNKALSKRN